MSEKIMVEFTIEPFTDGTPGHHVTKAIAAVEALGVEVHIGPFGSSFVAETEKAAEAIAVLSRMAYDNGATHITIDTEKVG
jgi:uncharacterized protein YqgV (UPF0045/DUF77 family)